MHITLSYCSDKKYCYFVQGFCFSFHLQGVKRNFNSVGMLEFSKHLRKTFKDSNVFSVASSLEGGYRFTALSTSRVFQ